ncbi:MAG TPA: sigma-54 dependent transcriptional regulator [Nitrospirota bacterium]|nr:sigma-54 dependent transcriptional regulator [Nitrospirota bacterium]
MATPDGKKVLIVDDEPNAIKVLSAILREEGYLVHESMSVDHAVGLMQSVDVDAVITDLKMPDKDGFQLFDHIAKHHPHTPVLFLTACASVESAVTSITSGAYYYFLKPPDYTKLKNILKTAIEEYTAHKKLEDLKTKSSRQNGVPPCVWEAPSMVSVMETVETVKDSESSVLLQGETGTGKEVIASNLHYRSKRFDKPFVAINCAAIPRELIESELFGYEKGAFSGAAASRTGKFEEAMGGTLFLDEIGELNISVQAKLLRVLQEREIERLGTNKKIKVNFRLISSTNKNLKREVEQGTFREDLFYRLNVVQITVPPLRERKQDIPLLAMEFLNIFSLRENRPFFFSDEVMEILMQYDWPGNVRQLKNVIEQTAVLARVERITVNELPEEFRGHRRHLTPGFVVKPLKVLESQAIAEALNVFQGNKSKAARSLGISRKTFYKRLNGQ